MTPIETSPRDGLPARLDQEFRRRTGGGDQRIGTYRFAPPRHGQRRACVHQPLSWYRSPTSSQRLLTFPSFIPNCLRRMDGSSPDTEVAPEDIILDELALPHHPAEHRQSKARTRPVLMIRHGSAQTLQRNNSKSAWRCGQPTAAPARSQSSGDELTPGAAQPTELSRHAHLEPRFD